MKMILIPSRKTDSPKTDEQNLSSVCMNKSRLVSFFDAVLAIIMTILVLGLQMPETPSVGAFWAMRTAFFSYAFSFFWLGTLWITHSSVFHNVTIINNRIVALSLVLLFVCSIVPYLTLLTSSFFYSSLIQTFFGIDMFLINLTAIFLFRETVKADPDNRFLSAYVAMMNRILLRGLLLKIIGIVITMAVYPPATLLIVAFGALVEAVSKYRTDKRIQKRYLDPEQNSQ